MLEHGGRLRQAAQQYGMPLAGWLDLSTGINPNGYPVPALSPACWQRLPEEDDGLEAVAAAYYGNARLLPLPGSQAAIRLLPALFPPASVACLTPIYEEHPHAWARAGHQVRRLQAPSPAAALQRALAAATPLILLCTPNNPTADRLPRDVLLDAADRLNRRGGWLIADEAFGDADPGRCLAPFAGSEQAPRLIVLRSLGKFFGLAGARVGFAFGAAEKLAPLREALGPWPISGPARAAARHALADAGWQKNARQELAAASARLAKLLDGLGEISACALFATVKTPAARELHETLARHAILTRVFDKPSLLRVGLPGSEADWQRLRNALKEWKPRC
ncbi:MAG: threonine-phosphate decarboxylase [Betaproteobacteria bacterium]|nr:threonine-phosphate decarboxylase [Betaproteobacteria bacterium]